MRGLVRVWADYALAYAGALLVLTALAHLFPRYAIDALWKTTLLCVIATPVASWRHASRSDAPPSTGFNWSATGLFATTSQILGFLAVFAYQLTANDTPTPLPWSPFDAVIFVVNFALIGLLFPSQVESMLVAYGKIPKPRATKRSYAGLGRIFRDFFLAYLCFVGGFVAYTLAFPPGDISLLLVGASQAAPALLACHFFTRRLTERPDERFLWVAAATMAASLQVLCLAGVVAVMAAVGDIQLLVDPATPDARPAPLSWSIVRPHWLALQIIVYRLLLGLYIDAALKQARRVPR